MATQYTPNYNLRMPDPDDFVEIEHLNQNFGIIDDVIDETSRALGAHTADLSIHVTPEAMEGYDIAIRELVAHTEDAGIHVTAVQKAEWDAGAATAAAHTADIAALQNVDTGHAARITRLEDALFSNITGNPWTVTFDALTGLTLAKGNWNEALQRLEC